MLAEKFLLLLETLRSNAYDDSAPRIVTTSPHIAIELAGTRFARDRGGAGHHDSQRICGG